MSRRVVVVGAGIIGLCAADALLQRGYRVTVLERDATPGHGASYGNGGLVVPSHFEPLAAPGMVMTGLRMLRSKESPFGFSGVPGLEMAAWMARFAQAGTHAKVSRAAPILSALNLTSRGLFEARYADLDASYTRRGELMVCRTQKTLDAEAHVAEKAAPLGLATRVLDTQELRDFEPDFPYNAAGAVYFEDDAHLSPAHFMPALRRRLIAQGVEIRDACEVRDATVEGRRVTRIGNIPADEVVLAAGAWTGRLARRLGLKLPLLAGKGYGITVPEPPALPRHPAILVDGRVAMTPMRDGLRFVGTMELGLPSEPTENPARVRGMRRAISETCTAFRDVDLSSLPVWSGLRPCAPDGMPYLGRTRRMDNVTIATGHGMMGMSLGPVSGELVAQIVAGETPTLPLDLLSPDRYG